LIFESPPRPRRRVIGRIVWPILILAAVTLGLVVSAAGTETRIQIEYLSQIHDYAVQMSRNGEALRGVAARLETISRDEFDTVNQEILEDLAEAMAFVEEDPPVLSVIPVRSLFRQALTAWEVGVEGFYESILDASDNPDDVTALDRIAAALAEIRAGDLVYEQLLVELEREDLPSPLAPLPEVVMSPVQGGLVSQSAALASAARSENNTLTLRPGLMVSQIVADPEWQLDANGMTVLRTTETVTFSVVISNRGNVVSGTQSVILTLTGTSEVGRQIIEVEPLRPGLAVTLIFDAIAVDPGASYEVTATLQDVTEDINFNDNTITVEFTVNTD